MNMESFPTSFIIVRFIYSFLIRKCGFYLIVVDISFASCQ